jgi:hypothetical protein
MITKIFYYAGIVFSFIVMVAMIKLFKYNQESTGLWFAIAMAALGIATFVVTVVHTIINKDPWSGR